jgi:hypothetical protein
MGDLEERLGARLDAASELLRPWLEERGFPFLEVEEKYARINIARANWLSKKQPWVWFTLDALLPYGYKRVQEEHPYVWVDTRNMERPDRSKFQEYLTNRLKGKEGGWLNDDCSRDHPAGRYIESYSDRERLALAQSSEAIAAFAREVLPPILALADDVEAALKATLGK